MGCGFKRLKNAETNDHKVPAHDFQAVIYRPTLTKGASATLVPPEQAIFFFSHLAGIMQGLQLHSQTTWFRLQLSRTLAV